MPQESRNTIQNLKYSREHSGQEGVLWWWTQEFMCKVDGCNSSKDHEILVQEACTVCSHWSCLTRHWKYHCSGETFVKQESNKACDITTLNCKQITCVPGARNKVCHKKCSLLKTQLKFNVIILPEEFNHSYSLLSQSKLNILSSCFCIMLWLRP